MPTTYACAKGGFAAVAGCTGRHGGSPLSPPSAVQVQFILFVCISAEWLVRRMRGIDIYSTDEKEDKLRKVLKSANTNNILQKA